MSPGNLFSLNPPLPELFKKAAWRMRKKPTRAEKRLWDALRLKRLDGLRFRQQHTIVPYIVDFFCFQAKLVIEVDGSSHFGREAEDRIRDQNLENLGYKVLRVTNQEVLNAMEEVKEKIRKEILKSGDSSGEMFKSTPNPSHPPSGG